MKLPEISADDIKEWWKRHDQDIGLPDEVVEEIAARGNARAQRLEDEREQNRLKHSSQGTQQEERREVQSQAGEQPDPGAIQKESPT